MTCFAKSWIVAAFLLFRGALPAQSVVVAPGAEAHRISRYLCGPALDLQSLLTGPPPAGSAAAEADLQAVLQAQAKRTPAQVRRAQRDDREESMFAFATVLGEKFRAEDLPLTAALSLHLRAESGVLNPGLKKAFGRARPFRASARVHAVCEQTASESYPSGHAMVGYLEGFTLAAMVPERKTEILARAREYAANRVICGVHYPSDVEASRTIALALFGALLTSNEFNAETAAARTEVREKLGRTLGDQVSDSRAGLPAVR